MPRKPFICDPLTPYHVYNRCINKDWFSQPIDEVWKIFSTYLWFSKYAFNLRIHGFILMNNHFHLLVSAPDGNLSEAMCYFQSMTSRELIKSSGRINHTFARKFGRCRISTYQYYLNAYKYIFFNPIDAGIVTRTEEYPYSSIGTFFNSIEFGVPIHDEIFCADPSDTIKWINHKPDRKKYELIGKALRKKDFKYCKRSLSKLKIDENYLI